MENEDVCGITTGGEENCEWDCISFLGFYKNPECLIDCFDENHCAFKALKDYESAGGICGGSDFGQYVQILQILPTTTKQCEYVTVMKIIDSVNVNRTYTSRGIFTQATLDLLIQNETCIYDVHRKSPLVFNTLELLMFSSSNLEVFQFWSYFSGRIITGYPKDKIQDVLPLPFSRLHPGIR